MCAGAESGSRSAWLGGGLGVQSSQRCIRWVLKDSVQKGLDISEQKKD